MRSAASVFSVAPKMCWTMSLIVRSGPWWPASGQLLIGVWRRTNWPEDIRLIGRIFTVRFQLIKYWNINMITCILGQDALSSPKFNQLTPGCIWSFVFEDVALDVDWSWNMGFPIGTATLPTLHPFKRCFSMWSLCLGDTGGDTGAGCQRTCLK